MLYHITTRSAWEQARTDGSYSPQSYAQDGFIHCSDLKQVEAVANRLYQKQPDLVILEIDPGLLNFPVVYENLEGGKELFPHIYGSPVPVESIKGVLTLVRDNLGELHLPAGIFNPRPPLFNLLPFHQAGKVYRSVMPGSFMFDENDEVLTLYTKACIDTVVVLNKFEDLSTYTYGDLLGRYRTAGLEIVHAPVADFSAPAKGAWDAVLAETAQMIRAGRTVAIHCHAGIGRTGMFVACLAQDLLGLSAEDSILWARQYIPSAIETEYQINFVLQYHS